MAAAGQDSAAGAAAACHQTGIREIAGEYQSAKSVACLGFVAATQQGCLREGEVALTEQRGWFDRRDSGKRERRCAFVRSAWRLAAAAVADAAVAAGRWQIARD